jgi:hypothetical protein
MKVEWRIFGGLFVFNAVVAWIYGYFSSWEPVGTVALTLSAALGLLVGYYFWFTGRRIGPRPEDRLDGEIHEAAGEMGFFSPHSWWPLPLAISFSITLLGIVFGWWITLVGGVLLLLSTVGFVFEYERGTSAGH